jgi:hypothetical protein
LGCWKEIIFKLGGAQFALDDQREESADIDGIETESSEAKIPYFAEQFFVEIQFCIV